MMEFWPKKFWQTRIKKVKNEMKNRFDELIQITNRSVYLTKKFSCNKIFFISQPFANKYELVNNIDC